MPPREDESRDVPASPPTTGPTKDRSAAPPEPDRKAPAPEPDAEEVPELLGERSDYPAPFEFGEDPGDVR